ncbi:hypothetical protein SLS62_004430 [Diatrype stigma]|uniref:Uncharacterized protein n=1 Tax=Diatrype stigma TaxID=117547 RepID=A0AAN9YT38_9PEZI
MPWASNPLLKPCSPPTPLSQSPSDTEAGSSRDKSSKGIPEGFRPPSEKFTLHQIFYIFLIDGLGGAIISGAINFAIAYDTRTSHITLWQFPYTLAGDGALSIPVQCIITWWLELWLVNRDLRRGAVQAIGFIPEPRYRWLRWFLFLDRPGQNHETGSWRHWLLFARSQFVRVLLVSAASFALVWPPSVLILGLYAYKCCRDVPTPKCHEWCYEKKWEPQIFKAIRGSVLGLLTTPLFVMLWLVRCGWALKSQRGSGLTGRAATPTAE